MLQKYLGFTFMFPSMFELLLNYFNPLFFATQYETVFESNEVENCAQNVLLMNVHSTFPETREIKNP